MLQSHSAALADSLRYVTNTMISFARQRTRGTINGNAQKFWRETPRPRSLNVTPIRERFTCGERNLTRQSQCFPRFAKK